MRSAPPARRPGDQRRIDPQAGWRCLGSGNSGKPDIAAKRHLSDREGEPQIQINANSDRMAAWTFHARGKKGCRSGRPALTSPPGANHPISLTNRRPPTWRKRGSRSMGRVAQSHLAQLRCPRIPDQASTTAFINCSWSSPATLAGPTRSRVEPNRRWPPPPRVTQTSSGARSTEWSPWRGGRPAERSARRRRSQSGPSRFGEPQITMDATGTLSPHGLHGTSPTHIAVAIDDVTPPMLSAIVMPSSVEVGAVAPMSASATDTLVTLHRLLGLRRRRDGRRAARSATPTPRRATGPSP